MKKTILIATVLLGSFSFTQKQKVDENANYSITCAQKYGYGNYITLFNTTFNSFKIKK